MPTRLLGVIPARGGSKGLPGKNIRTFAGIPLLAHTILFAKMCPQIERYIVSTDSAEIADVARQYGADVPFLRPTRLAQDETPVWQVVRHAVTQVEQEERGSVEYVVLLDPTSPAREPSDLSGALARLEANPSADGVVGVSRPSFNPIWHCVVERDGWMTDLIEQGGQFQRRQEVPSVYRINGSLYLWRAAFVKSQEQSWRQTGRHLIYEIPEWRAMSFDTTQEFEEAEELVKRGRVVFPWLSPSPVR